MLILLINKIVILGQFYKYMYISHNIHNVLQMSVFLYFINVNPHKYALLGCLGNKIKTNEYFTDF